MTEETNDAAAYAVDALKCVLQVWKSLLYSQSFYFSWAAFNAFCSAKYVSYSVVKICFSIDSRSCERAAVRSCQRSSGNEQLIVIRYAGLDLKMIMVKVQSKTTAELLDVGISRVTSRFKSRRIIYVL